jgi:tight adherence protein C
VTPALAAGAVVGLGIFLFTLALIPGRPSLARQLAAFDAAYSPAARARAGWAPDGRAGDGRAGRQSRISGRLGAGLAKLCAEQGWEFGSLRANLALAGKSFESYLATKLLLTVFGLLLGPLLLAMLTAGGVRLPFAVPVWAGLALAAIFFFLPDVELKQKVDKRRRDFRHAIGAFLDLVAMNLAGGRGVPEALMSASEIGTGWAMWRVRDALTNARITGQTPWQALGALGEEVRIDELRDLSAALSLVAEDGAKVRESLATRAASLRRRELADMQGQAGERSQSMLVAQMLLAGAFLIFLIYPAVRVMLGV